MKKSFLQTLNEHLKRYPLMEPQDFGKLAFQSEFGPEHMVSDGQQAESFLIEERKALPIDNIADILQEKQVSAEQVSESLCRFPLSICGSVDEVKLLAHLFPQHRNMGEPWKGWRENWSR